MTFWEIAIAGLIGAGGGAVIAYLLSIYNEDKRLRETRKELSISAVYVLSNLLNALYSFKIDIGIKKFIGYKVFIENNSFEEEKKEILKKAWEDNKKTRELNKITYPTSDEASFSESFPHSNLVQGIADGLYPLALDIKTLFFVSLKDNRFVPLLNKLKIELLELEKEIKNLNNKREQGLKGMSVMPEDMFLLMGEHTLNIVCRAEKSILFCQLALDVLVGYVNTENLCTMTPVEYTEYKDYAPKEGYMGITLEENSIKQKNDCWWDQKEQ
jgi:hypothetical protein